MMLQMFISIWAKKREGYSWYEYMGLEQACGDNYKYVLEKECDKFENEHIIFKPKEGENTKEFYKMLEHSILVN